MNSPNTTPVRFTIHDVNKMTEPGVFVGRTDRIELIEVAVSSQDHDLVVKQRLYAMEQIAEYWVVLPQSATIIVHRQPLGERYSHVETSGIGQTVSPGCIPEATLDLEWLFRG